MGTGLAWTSPTFPRISGEACIEDPDSCFIDEPFSAEQASWIGSLFAIGALLVNYAVRSIHLCLLANKFACKEPDE